MRGPLNWLLQIAAVTRFNLRSLPQRKGSSATAMFGIAGVVAVMVSVLSIAHGIVRMMENSAAPGNVIVMRAGANTEMMSALMGEATDIIAEGPGIARNELGAMASPELFVVINLPMRSTGTDANVPMRGVQQQAFTVREGFRIVAGRMFEWGLNEVIVGAGAQHEFAGLELGETIEVGREAWRVVGVFEANGGIAESEIWVDAAVLQPAYRRGNSFQSVFVRLDSPQDFAAFRDALATDPRLSVKVTSEQDYYAEQSVTVYRLITVLGTLVAVIMGLGAVFGALNTMYTATASRTREIATLRALGFQAGPVVVSVLTESLLLALAGGAVGAALAWLAFDGFQAATLNWASFSAMTFTFNVSPPLLVQGIVYALLIGLVGGLFPAVRAARQPVAVALREL
ncbi:MAG: FtsX-like permease family protein [Xanthomonadales bacterium]|nr:FtsX-like permease family protein [Xanthomonadales bacterium]NIN58846.1 FtsX-like permease family protein [Xanthomonadales bacterium]NIN74114.1 FtsX-like permease family protein [Xanthomonadales bacterium]NIO14647.1 FtsX-like permease family protein [Xanthomonadales bacterium]NIP11239.1 FtsX-like permease family protein [Xanthomonadales bacterium]